MRGIGSDVVEIRRVEQALARHGERFLARVLNPEELREAEVLPAARRVEFVAGRFAAKEAVAKALGCGIGRLGMPRVGIVLEDTGLVARFAAWPAGVPPVGRVLVSITHTRELAFAVAVWDPDG
ncbi:holo-ACP synthase [Alicyclobacillus macrosporangiidus]|uniref:Holo-[acyl-carrier-protein] synthase n=1 Tax=Alicyclobacillus macrosporangiidus TaxID=392015 RepID=A0A1I7KIZ4_9BACL|nr:holo-ACP synthase [Alicyclobacillus macrosporangiidus]SFU97423.1 holo-[acyl-carrier protein] synthase [Alicyclobacillus macrosporangiidus]